MLDEEVKTNIIQSSISYFMNNFSFTCWPEKKVRDFIQQELDSYLKQNTNCDPKELFSLFLWYLENKTIETISKKVQLPESIDVIQGLINFIKNDSKYDAYTKLQKLSTIFTNKLRSNEHYLTFLKENNSILEIITLNVDLNKEYTDILDQQEKDKIDLIAQDKKVRSFVEDYCIANDIDTINLFDNVKLRDNVSFCQNSRFY